MIEVVRAALRLLEEDEHLRRLAADVPREAAPIDEFYNSLAGDMGERAGGIVLSGTGHDGAFGLKAIKTRGGLTLVQGHDDANR